MRHVSAWRNYYLDMKDIKLRLALDENRIHYVDINNAKISEKYYCPFCGNEVYPKALKSDYVRRHFCHYNSECNKEGIEHLMTKYYILDKDMIFVNNEFIHIDKTKTLLEYRYKTKFGDYIPDATLFKTDGQRIFLEIKNNNSKDDSYIPKYLELKSDVLEYDIKSNKLYYLFKDNNYCGKNKIIRVEKEFFDYTNNIDCEERLKSLYDFWFSCRRYLIDKDDKLLFKEFMGLNIDDMIFAIHYLKKVGCNNSTLNMLKQNATEIIKSRPDAYKNLRKTVSLYIEVNDITINDFSNMVNLKPYQLRRWINGGLKFIKLDKICETIGISNCATAIFMDHDILIDEYNHIGLGYVCNSCKHHDYIWINWNGDDCGRRYWCSNCERRIIYEHKIINADDIAKFAKPTESRISKIESNKSTLSKLTIEQNNILDAVKYINNAIEFPILSDIHFCIYYGDERLDELRYNGNERTKQLLQNFKLVYMEHLSNINEEIDEITDRLNGYDECRYD